MRDRLCTALEGFLESLLDAGVCWSNVVHDIPNSKSQISDKSQIFTLWNPAFGRFAQGEIPQGKYQMIETGLEICILINVICPSTWLRVVSLSNHLHFVICYLEFFSPNILEIFNHVTAVVYRREALAGSG